MTRPRLVVATRSEHKLRELRELLQLDRAELVSLDDLGIRGEPLEDGATFEANAALKARWATRQTGLPALADDSGLEVDALGGAPGVRSRRFFGADATADDRNRMLLGLLDAITERTARFVCVIAFAQPDGRVETFDGEIRGEIADAPRGATGFGYDPLFIIAGDGRTMAELDGEEKNAISHRGLAAAKLRAALAGGVR